MKYEVGDIVRVREDLQAGNDNDSRLWVTSDMVDLAGKLLTICAVDDCGYYRVEENDFIWADKFFEDEDEIIKEEEKSDEYDDIIDKVLSEMTEETKDTLIKQFIKGENKIAITASPIYKMISRTNGVSIQQIVGTKYGVSIINKDGMVTL